MSKEQPNRCNICGEEQPNKSREELQDLNWSFAEIDKPNQVTHIYLRFCPKHGSKQESDIIGFLLTNKLITRKKHNSEVQKIFKDIDRAQEIEGDRVDKGKESINIVVVSKKDYEELKKKWGAK